MPTKRPIGETEFNEHKRDVYSALIIIFIIAVLGIIF